MFRFIYYFTKTIKNCFNFLFVKRLTLACLVKTSITHNKYLTCQFLKIIIPFQLNLQPKITFKRYIDFSSCGFIIPGLCNSLAST